jgi:tight adherence protein B
MDPNSLMWIAGGGAFVFALLILSAFSGGADADLQKRIARVGPGGKMRRISVSDRGPQSLRHAGDSTIPLVNKIIHMLPNPDKLRARLGRTGKNIHLGEYLMVNALAVLIFLLIFRMMEMSQMVYIPLSFALGFGIPHAVIGIIGAKRLKKFLAVFPEAIDTMCRGLRSGLPVTESIAAVGREMPDPIGIEFRRVADGVRMGKTLEASMWEVAKRIDTPEWRFLIIAMAIQKETGGNLAETLGNLADLIRRRRQLRLKIKAMSSEAKASAMIIGSLPFIMFCLLMVVNPDYIMTLFTDPKGKVMMGIGLFWMSMGCAVMAKMISFEL